MRIYPLDITEPVSEVCDCDIGRRHDIDGLRRDREYYGRTFMTLYFVWKAAREIRALGKNNV